MTLVRSHGFTPLYSFQREAESRALAAAGEPFSPESAQLSQDDITIIEDTEPLNAFAQLWEALI